MKNLNFTQKRKMIWKLTNCHSMKKAEKFICTVCEFSSKKIYDLDLLHQQSIQLILTTNVILRQKDRTRLKIGKSSSCTYQQNICLEKSYSSVLIFFPQQEILLKQENPKISPPDMVAQLHQLLL